MSTNAHRLARAVRARREELDLSQLDVWQAGGPSNTTLTEIENGRVERLTRTTARRLDIGLRWEQGSARRVWDGGEATPATGDASTAERADLRRRVQEATSLTADEKATILATLESHDNPTGEVRGA